MAGSTDWNGRLYSNRASQNLKEEDLDLNSYDDEKEGKNQGKNFLTLRVRILTLILTLQGKNSYPDSYPDSYPANIFPLASSPTLASCPIHYDDDTYPSALLLFLTSGT